MSQVIKFFPCQEALTTRLAAYFRNHDYYRDKQHITDVVITLASGRFANEGKTCSGIQFGAMTIVYDMQNGKNDFPQEKLLSFASVTRPEWLALFMNTEIALHQCAIHPDVTFKGGERA